ncbi:MAG: hypothetical protein GEU83_07495 [Pseudonocardiaceae bacterium]|nr:hypothetical protein [Pseudonocardiaceae bacterium]
MTTCPARRRSRARAAHRIDSSAAIRTFTCWRTGGDLLAVTERDGQPGLDPAPLRLLERLRRQRALERGCRQGIAAAEPG